MSTAISINVVRWKHISLRDKTSQGNMGFLYLSSPKSAVPCLPYNNKVYGRVFKVLKLNKKPEKVIFR